MKKIQTIRPDAPFLDTLAADIWHQAEGDGFKLSRMLILLPTRRACRLLGAAFARLAGDKPVLLPHLRPLGESDEDEITFADSEGLDLPPAIAPLNRLLLLTQQVQRRDPTLSWDQAAQAAEALTRFLDQVQIEQCDLGLLPDLVQEQELAEHWQQTLLFLDIVTKNWPLILESQGCLDPAQRRNAVLTAQTDLWRKNPPAFPVIAAGSTGSLPTTAALLDVIAALPEGRVVLPGLDLHLEDTAWDAIDDTHPQHSMKKLLARMGVDRSAVRDLAGAHPPSPRARLISEAMRPANSTEAWRALNGKLGAQAVQGLTLLTLDHPQEEAQIIALRLRHCLDNPDHTAAFITGDRALAARVAALLQRWDIDADDSGGTPLSMTPIGGFLSLVLAAAAPQSGALDQLALLKHPLAACGLSPPACREAARQSELRVRRLQDETITLAADALQNLRDTWNAPLPLGERIAQHRRAAETIAASPDENGATRLWRGENGEATAAWLDEWNQAAIDFPAVSGEDYQALFGSLASSQTLRSTRAAHPRLSILGPLEARLCTADLVIMGGMNEGLWPPDAGFDPWMSRPMRQKFKLPSPEFRIGLSAHDFAQLACAPQVMLTRSLRANGTPTVPSRFLLQIDTVLRAAHLSTDAHDALSPLEPWRAWARLLDAPQPDEIKPCPRPRPCPPLSARPTLLSVTEITTWQRNPYAIYAKHILKVRKLDELDAELDASDKGTMIHAALEQFVRTYPDALPDDAHDQLLAIGRSVFAQASQNPRVRAFWWARFIDIAAWFVDEERKRRANGVTLVAVEAKGRLVLSGLTLTGRADRIDCLGDNVLQITDYKTGASPKKKEVLSGLEPQLQLLALIAARGGFDKIAPANVGALEYWILKGGKQGCKIDSFSAEIPALITEAGQGLSDLIQAFADSASLYDVAPRPRLMPHYDDYAHLARMAEWGRGSEET